MAIVKTVAASSSYIVTPNTTAVGYSYSSEPEVFSTILDVTRTSASTVTSTVGLIPPLHMTKPGVFTAGTPQEGTASNPTNDANY
jgi:hypothetical protein